MSQYMNTYPGQERVAGLPAWQRGSTASGTLTKP